LIDDDVAFELRGQPQNWTEQDQRAPVVLVLIAEIPDRLHDRRLAVEAMRVRHQHDRERRQAFGRDERLDDVRRDMWTRDVGADRAHAFVVAATETAHGIPENERRIADDWREPVARNSWIAGLDANQRNGFMPGGPEFTLQRHVYPTFAFM